MAKKIILEAHNIKNPTTGFGVFNHSLLTAMAKKDLSGLDIKLCTYKPAQLKAEFGSAFKYKKVFGFSRYPQFRVRDSHDLWHSLNQNTKIEPRRVSKYLLTVHDVNFADDMAPADLCGKRTHLFREKLERATAITYISEYAKRHTHEFFRVPNVPEYVIYNGNPVTSLENTDSYVPDVPVDAPYIYSLGDFLEKKNFVSLVKMMPHLPGYNLIISGNNQRAYAEEVRLAIDTLGLGNRVFLNGKVSNTGKQYFMKNCAAFALPSKAEGFGLPPIEAMTFGRPIFLANRASLPEVGGPNAFYWDDFAPEYMAKVFLAGLEAYHNRPDFYIDAYKQQAARFNWNDAAQQYLDVYNSIL
ncbi:glycosyl transferase family 1 [Flavobacterium akiainvivens]|uniref:Glycosyl transferase family 1 n=1 Tax=Flavobacterium akiainvivens TaxID=1202724 RepID=A0A0M9VJT8_9FLAO|nr:glycosyltransferase family 1 protein [Flavobacterium akiainvivens]KOS08129.1 glycosyl transferase family 1 [Flavobacterium akiainvivens]SFQ72146.1 Glycosyltransferase involved in cell wall bisynthesis [Flavobacterium akiainvivens]